MPTLCRCCEASASIHYKLAVCKRSPMWHGALVAASLAVSVCHLDVSQGSVELPWGLAIVLCILRLWRLRRHPILLFGLESERNGRS